MANQDVDVKVILKWTLKIIECVVGQIHVEQDRVQRPQCCEQGIVPRDSIKCGEFFTFKHAPIASQEVVCARDVSTSVLKLLIETAVQRKGKTEEHSSKTTPPFCE